jgi:hypothetical protein
MATRRKMTQAEVARKYGWRSSFESVIADQLKEAGMGYGYETMKISYTWPERGSIYTPDFVLANGIIVETKGRFLTPDRQKMALIKKQHPDLDIRFVFMNAKTKISPKSPTSYASWAEKHGFKWAEKRIPDSWLNEVRK